MTPLPVLIAGGAVAAICARLRCRRSAAYLAAWVVADVARLLLAPLRAEAPLPYEGRARLLWMVCEVAPLALPPAALLAAARLGAHAAVAWSVAVAAVAVSYPAVRGTQLLAAWSAYYAMGYAVAVSTIVVRARREDLGRDEHALLALALTGIASVAVVELAGASSWWAVTITYGCGLVGAVAAAVGFGEPREP